MEELKKEEQVALEKFYNFDNIIANVQAEEHLIQSKSTKTSAFF